MAVVRNLILGLVTLLLLSGCAVIESQKVGEVFQTNSVIEIQKDYKKTTELLLSLKDKLDKRNPQAFDKTKSDVIIQQIKSLKNTIPLSYNDMPLTSYKGYLQIAFSKDDIKHRNDFLILGLYNLIWEAYGIENSYKITAFEYDEELLQNLYKNLQILTWKIKVDRDMNNNYLFLTWQNNWQIQLEKKVRAEETITWESLQELEYINSGKESLYGRSNFSFEVMLLQMQNRVRMSLERLGTEPVDMSVQAIKSFFIFL